MIRIALLLVTFATACQATHLVGRGAGQCSTFTQDCGFGQICVDNIADGCDGTTFAQDCPGSCFLMFDGTITQTDIAIPQPGPDGFF